MSTLAKHLRDSGWEESALCAQTDPEVFFPERGAGGWGARAVCTGCPVQAECLLSWADHRSREGMWGGIAGETLLRMGAPKPPPVAARTIAVAPYSRLVDLHHRWPSEVADRLPPVLHDTMLASVEGPAGDEEVAA